MTNYTKPLIILFSYEPGSMQIKESLLVFNISFAIALRVLFYLFLEA